MTETASKNLEVSRTVLQPKTWAGVVIGMMLLLAVILICIAIFGGPPPSRPASNLEGDKLDTAYEVISQRWMAISSVIMVFISAGTLALLAGTLWVTRRMLMEAEKTVTAAEATIDVTRDIGKKQVRCYPTIDNITVGWPNGLTEPYISMTWRNAGNSPAISPEITVKANITEFNSSTETSSHRIAIDACPIYDAPAQSLPSEHRLSHLETICAPTTSYRDLSHIEIRLEICLFATDVFKDEICNLRIFTAAAHVTQMHINDTEFIDNSASLRIDTRERLIAEHKEISTRYNT